MLSLDEYVSAVKHNLSGPLPLCVYRFDQALEVFVSNLGNSGNASSAKMFVLGFSSLRSAVAAALGGSTTQVPVLLRHSLEAGLYGFLFRFDADMLKDWEQREFSRGAKDRFRNGGLKSAKKVLKHKDEFCYERIFAHYENLITFGAHPNVFQVEGNITYTANLDDDHGVAHITILAGRDERLASFVSVCQSYELLAQLMKLVFPERFMILDIHRRLQEAAAATVDFIILRRQGGNE